MNGATTEPWVKKIRAPIKKIVKINGANQYFLRIIKNSQNSAKIESLDMCDII